MTKEQRVQAYHDLLAASGSLMTHAELIEYETGDLEKVSSLVRVATWLREKAEKVYVQASRDFDAVESRRGSDGQGAATVGVGGAGARALVGRPALRCKKGAENG